MRRILPFVPQVPRRAVGIALGGTLGVVGVALPYLAVGAPASDGSLTVSTSGRVVNTYTSLASDVSAAATSFTVTDVNELDDTSSTPFATTDIGSGTLLLIVQMNGATVTTSNTSAFGAITSYNSAGRYEFVWVSSVSGNTITIDTALNPSGLQYAYDADVQVQVIRVPVLTSLTVSSGASITSPAWDGATGGIVAMSVTGAVSLSGTIDVAGLGFRGGATENNTSTTTTGYRSSSSSDGAEKGEGIYLTLEDMDTANINFQRGAPANGGGGGNAHNAGGGGGSNGDNGNTWTGQGVMDSADAAYWDVDPAYTSAGGLTNSSGGGRGGYTWGQNDRNASTEGPGDTDWGGDNREQVGGLGGRPLTADPDNRVFMGGGGGAGDGNNSRAGAGGEGGGIVFLFASGAVSGSGTINADGADGDDTVWVARARGTPRAARARVARSCWSRRAWPPPSASPLRAASAEIKPAAATATSPRAPAAAAAAATSRSPAAPRRRWTSAAASAAPPRPPASPSSRAMAPPTARRAARATPRRA